MYSVPEHIDPAKVFLVRRSELKNRIDAPVYRKGFSFKSEIFPKYPLAEIAYINPSTSFEAIDDEAEITFVPMEVIDENNGIIINPQTKKVKDSKGFTRFIEGDLIWAKITPCMQNGKSAIVRNTLSGYACGSTEFFVIRPKSSSVKVEYIHFLLRDKRILDHAKNFFGGTAGQQRVSKDFLIDLSVPLPPIKIQEKIVAKIQQANSKKQQKEAEAQTLLANINAYLLKELGITLPEKKNDSEHRFFITNFKDVIIGNRLDPLYYYSDLDQFNNGTYTSIPLKQLAYHFKSGIGAGKQDQVMDQNGIIQVRPTNINEYGDLVFTKNVYVPLESGMDNLEPGDVLFNNTNSQDLVGKTAIYKGGKKLTYSNHITVIRTREDVLLPEYLWCILNSFQNHKIFYSICTNWNNQSGVGVDLLKSLSIPLPPIKKQNEIASHIQTIRTKANALKEEAKQTLEKAKQHVEQMILGQS